MNLPLADPVEVLAGDFRLSPVWSGAAPGYAGLAATRFKITSELPAASTLELRVSVNGRESNKVLLPIE
jgi:uncharacterized protein (TIGR03437 family)